ncbi:PfkB family carbohydrate kinase [Alteromonas gracilis]
MSVLVVGGINLDVLARSDEQLARGTSNPGQVRRTPGGVARNITEGLARLGEQVHLVSRVGPEPDAARMLADLAVLGVDVTGVRVDDGARTGCYTAVLDRSGDLIAGIADMAVVEQVSVDDTPDPAAFDLVVLDGNLTTATQAALLERCASSDARVLLDPVGTAKAARLAALPDLPLDTITPNLDELTALGGVESLHARGVACVWVRRGAEGSTLSIAGAEPVHVPATRVAARDVTGAGDAMLAAYAHRLLAGDDPATAAAWGATAAALTVTVDGAVHPDLDAAMLRRHHEGVR